MGPLMVYCASLLDTLLMALYQKWLHPWRRILAKGLSQEPQKLAEEKEETSGDAQSPLSQGMPKEPEHSSGTEIAELHVAAHDDGQEIMISQLDFALAELQVSAHDNGQEIMIGQLDFALAELQVSAHGDGHETTIGQ